MSVANFSVFAEVVIEARLLAWENGEVQWTVSNQFDEGILESAKANIKNVSDEQWLELYNRFNCAEYGFNEKRISPMDIARFIDDKFEDAENDLNDFIDSQYE